MTHTTQDAELNERAAERILDEWREAVRLAEIALADRLEALSQAVNAPQGEAVAWPTPMDVDRIIEDHWIMGEGPHPDVNEAIIKLFKERFDASPALAEPCRECAAVSSAIGGPEFMDPPDGGDVSLSEQVRRMREALNAARALAEPEGWKLVPVEPTVEMLQAAQDAETSTGWGQAAECWEAMVNAASPTVEER